MGPISGERWMMISMALGAIGTVFLFLYLGSRSRVGRLNRLVAQKDRAVAAAESKAENARREYETKTAGAFIEAKEGVAKAQLLIEELRSELKADGDRAVDHYEAEATRIQARALEEIEKARNELESLKKYRGIQDAEAEARTLLEKALEDAKGLQAEAHALLEQSRLAAKQERMEASQKAKELREQADRILDRATRESGRIVEEAHKRA